MNRNVRTLPLRVVLVFFLASVTALYGTVPASAVTPGTGTWVKDNASSTVSETTLTYAFVWGGTVAVSVPTSPIPGCVSSCTLTFRATMVGMNDGYKRPRGTVAYRREDGSECKTVSRYEDTPPTVAVWDITITGGCTDGSPTYSAAFYDTEQGSNRRGVFTFGAPPPTPKPVLTAGNCIMTDVQLIGLARQAGIPENQLIKAGAIAIAESAGRVNALNTNPSPLSYDIGLWQINNEAHPSYNMVTLGTNPLFNASAAKDVYTTANAWTPWATFNSGVYSKYLSRASAAFTASSGESISLINCSGGTANSLDSDGDGVNDIVDPDTDKDSSCGFTFNPLKATKCALSWAFVPKEGAMNQWQEQIDTIQASSPVVNATNAASQITALTNGGGYTASTIPTCLGLGAANNCQATGSDFAYGAQILEAAKISNVSGFGHVLYLLEKMGICLFFAFFWWNRLTASVGGKSDI